MITVGQSATAAAATALKSSAWLSGVWRQRKRLSPKAVVAGSLVLLLGWKVACEAWFSRLPPSTHSILCSFGRGRLGNQMSSYASLYAFSQMYGLKHYVTQEQATMLNFYFEDIPTSILEVDLAEHYVSLFGIRLNRLWWEVPWTKLDYVDNNFNYSNIRQRHLYQGHAINAGDFPNEIKSYKQYMPELRRRFRLRPRFLEAADWKLNLAAAKLDMKRGDLALGDIAFISVHIRRGDYREHLEKLYGLPLLDKDYFLMAMDYFRTKFSNTAFIVVSDDLQWALNNLQDDDVFFLGHSKVLEKDTRRPLTAGEDVGEDLALLASCNHSILSYGTFGLWGALLAGGEVISPSTARGTKEGREMIEGGLDGAVERQGAWHWMEVSHSSTPSLHKEATLLIICTLLLQIILYR